MSENILCCAPDAPSVGAALRKALTPAFREKAKRVKSPFDGGDTSGRIVRRLERFLQSGEAGRPKCFYDAIGEGSGR